MNLLDDYEGDDVVFGSDDGQGISTWAVGNVFGNPCHSNDTLLEPPIDSSVDGLVAGLASQKGHPGTTPTDVEVDGYAGKYYGDDGACRDRLGRLRPRTVPNLGRSV